MISFLVKLVTIPVLLLIAVNTSEQIGYSEIWQPLVIMLLLLGLGLGMEYMILRENTLGLSTSADFIVSFLIIYFFSNVFDGGYATFFASVVLSLILTICEYFLHRYLIQAGRVERVTA